MRNNLRLGTAAAVTASLFYALVPNFAKQAFLNGIPALETVAVRTCITALVLLPTAIFAGKSLRVPAVACRSLLFQGLATLAVSVCYISSLQFITVGLSVLIFFSYPVLIVLFSPIIERRPFQAVEVALALLAFVGLALAIGPRISSLNPLGILLAALAAIGCASQTISARVLSNYLDPIVFGGLVHLLILPLIISLAFATGPEHVALLQQKPSWIALGSVLLVGLCYCVAYFMQMTSVKWASPAKVAPYYNLEPLLATLLAIFLLGEKLSVMHIVGGAMVMTALVATQLISKVET